jgi:hypothetical protein
LEFSKGSPVGPYQASLSANLRYIQLRHFGEMMDRLASYHASIDAATEHFRRGKAEVEAEWRREMDFYEVGERHQRNLPRTCCAIYVLCPSLPFVQLFPVARGNFSVGKSW